MDVVVAANAINLQLTFPNSRQARLDSCMRGLERLFENVARTPRCGQRSAVQLA
jgi:hypothetical protein